MSAILRVCALGVAAYALGCMVAGYYVVRCADGRDIRLLGSGNAGARNVMRSHGRMLAALTLLADAGKAAIAVLAAHALFREAWIPWFALAAVMAGHVWPAQLRFRGGKGAASAIGGLPLLLGWLGGDPHVIPWAAAVVLITWYAHRARPRWSRNRKPLSMEPS